MKITRLQTFKMTAGWRNWLFVKLETDAGHVGWGEGSMEGREQGVEAVICEIADWLVGKDPRRVEQHWTELYRNGYWRAGPVMCSALGALDMAMWDIKGKALGAPVHELLGGPIRNKLRYYSNAWYFGASSPEEFATAAQQAVSQGAKALKWDPFWESDLFPERRHLELAFKRVQAVREAVGPNIDLLIEVHGRLSPANAIYAASRLEEFDPFLLEEPVPPDNVDALALVARSTKIPIAAGERVYTKWGFRELLEKQAVAIIQPDHIHTGGITEGKKIAAMAEVYYISVAPHCATGPVLTAANLQLGAAIPNFLIQELFTPDMPLYDQILNENFVHMEDGYVDVPTKPGLGVELNESVLEMMEYRPVGDLGRLFRGIEEMT